jgi:hypothetical protein
MMVLAPFISPPTRAFGIWEEEEEEEEEEERAGGGGGEQLLLVVVYSSTIPLWHTQRRPPSTISRPTAWLLCSTHSAAAILLKS